MLTPSGLRRSLARSSKPEDPFVLQRVMRSIGRRDCEVFVFNFFPCFVFHRNLNGRVGVSLNDVWWWRGHGLRLREAKTQDFTREFHDGIRERMRPRGIWWECGNSHL